jgi:hypothetical protein
MDAGNGATGREPTPLGDLLANPNAARIYDYWLGVISSPVDDHGVDLRGHVVDIVLDGS